ncbi:MAG TPA: FkbM family methyltransferase, partial [candidate division Zixibacteria bacterium]|nr:FkbM family methyltransferase [candidate division Zixibacteria bacterium]
MIKQIAKLLIRYNANLPRQHFYEFVKWTTLRDVIRNLRINCVLDVGANRGQFASTLRDIGYSDHIISFEPSPHDFSILAQRFSGDLLWRGMNYALGERDCT